MAKERSSKAKGQSSNQAASPPTDQEQQSPKYPPRWITPTICGSVLTGGLLFSAVNGQWHEIWFEYFFVPIAILVVCFGLYELLSIRTKIRPFWRILLSIISLVLLSGGVVLAYWKLQSPPFAVLVTWQGSMNPLWCLEDECVTTIHGSMLINFINKTSNDIMIDSYFIEGEKTNGIWEAATYQTHYFPLKIFCGDLENARELKYETFDSVIENREIESFHTAKGWVFFTRPFWNYSRFRFSFRTSDGQYYSPQLFGFTGSLGSLPPIMGSLPPIMYTGTTNHEDLRHFRMLNE
jgi:hypothetical protein